MCKQSFFDFLIFILLTDVNKVVCLSDCGMYVIASCNVSDFDIWNMKTTPSVSYKHSIQSHHR